MQQQGTFIQADFFANTGGLNSTDSPFAIKESQATDGRNYDYVRTGGIRKRKGYLKINSIADTQLYTLGLALRNTNFGVKTNIRAAGTKIQNFDLDAVTFTNLTEDTSTAGSDVFTSGSTQPVLFKNFNDATNNILWFVGGGNNYPYGAYSATKYTKNGVAAPTGSITATPAADSATFAATGTYFYAVVFRKTSTQALSNAALDVSATISATTQKVTINFTGISNLDTTKYDKIYLYRSAVSGVTSFTTGDLVAILNSNTTTYDDTGTATLLTQNVPRAGSTILDNSILPTSTIKTLTVFKRRLVTAVGNTLYFSDLNKPESWPTLNTITVPSGGDITALAVINFNTPTSTGIDEVLCIFKETECWVLLGTSISDWSLKFTSTQGCIAQQLVVEADGYLAFIEQRGIYFWDGAGKPIYSSRLIEDKFARDGDIDFSKLQIGFGVFSRRENMIRWVISHKTFGENKYSIKMDLRLTIPAIAENLNQRVTEAIFIQDTHDSFYAAAVNRPANQNDEVFQIGDSSGFVYFFNNGDSDGSGVGTPFYYLTKHHDMETPGTAKRFLKVIVWVEQLGTWNLTLDYWTNYRTDATNASTISQPISVDTGEGMGVWDVGFWEDVSPANNANTMFWDGTASIPGALTYNLADTNSEGDAIRLQFSQTGSEQPITILGYSIIYSILPLRK